MSLRTWGSVAEALKRVPQVPGYGTALWTDRLAYERDEIGEQDGNPGL